MSDITLTAGIRQNLLSLQQTSADLTQTQEALSTGNKVNSAAENPSAFFTSQNLTNSANSLSALLDQIGQGQQTIAAANNGLTGLTSLLEQALSTAQQAQQAPEPTSLSYGAINVNGTVASGFTESEGATTGNVDISGGTITTANAGNLLIATGGTTYTVAITAGESLANIEGGINDTTGLNGAVTATANSGNNLVLTANSVSTNFTVVASGTSAALGVTTNSSTNNTVDSTDLLDLLESQDNVEAGDTLTVAVNGGATQDIVFGTGNGQIQTFAQLNNALAGLSGATGSASSSAVSIQVAGSSAQNSLTIGTTGSSHAGSILTALGLTSGTTNGVADAGSPNSTRSTLQNNYNGLLTQIDQLAADSAYNGVNLLGGDNLVVDFNATGTSSLTISGVNFNSAGLGLSQISGTGFQSDANVTATISSINSAISSVQSQTETFGTNSGVINARQTFETNMINTLQTGASSLVAADQNAESADLLTEQTQQQLEISALSIANQANQSVLKLFG